VKAKHLVPGTKFTVDKPDPESAVRVGLANDEERGLRFGFPNKPGYWCYMGGEVDVDVIGETTKED